MSSDFIQIENFITLFPTCPEGQHIFHKQLGSYSLFKTCRTCGLLEARKIEVVIPHKKYL